MKARILIVDDESEIRQMLSRHFRMLGYEAVTAAHGLEALEQLQQAKTDVVISDIMMPEMDGLDLLKAIREQYPMIRSIMITGYVTQDNALACMRRGAETLIFKPLEDLAELEEAVARSVEWTNHWLNLLRKLQSMKSDQAEVLAHES